MKLEGVGKGDFLAGQAWLGNSVCPQESPLSLESVLLFFVVVFYPLLNRLNQRKQHTPVTSRGSVRPLIWG